jgi:AraC-like DNA-binding protein
VLTKKLKRVKILKVNKSEIASVKKEYFIEHRNNLKCRLHVNPELEVVYVIDGTLVVETEGGEKTELSGGEAMFVLPYKVHSFTPYDGVKARVLMFSENIISEFNETCKNKTFESFKFEVNHELKSFCLYALDKYKNSNDIYLIKSVFFALASAFVSQVEIVGKRSVNSGAEISRIMEYVCNNVGEQLTLTSTAKALSISKNALEKIFVEYTGTTFAKFLNNMRIEKAMTLLSASDKTVTEIAYECGFGSLRSFNRVFVSFAGKTPTVFKKEI